MHVPAAHHATEVGKPPTMDTTAKCMRYSVAAKSRHFLARSTCRWQGLIGYALMHVAD